MGYDVSQGPGTGYGDCHRRVASGRANAPLRNASDFTFWLVYVERLLYNSSMREARWDEVRGGVSHPFSALASAEGGFLSRRTKIIAKIGM
jgi:hypothetical protein